MRKWNEVEVQWKFSLDIRKKFFTENVVDPCKRFPRELVPPSSLVVFKEHLNEALSLVV